MDFYSLIVGLFININNDRPASFKAAGHCSTYFCRLPPDHKAAKHFSRDKHLARHHISKKKYKKNYIPLMPGLLTKK